MTHTQDTIAALNLYAIHNNPEIWDKPEEFRPERFLDENGKVANQETILPFGTGESGNDTLKLWNVSCGFF